jgi:drug/metabolite transporter (DMT)-like permease
LALLAVGLALASAVLHVSWNALVRAAIGSLGFVTVQVGSGAILAAAVAVATRSVVVPAAAWPWVGATVLVHAVYFRALAHSYHDGTLSGTYPAARGLGLMLTAPAAAYLFGQSMPAAAWVGVGLVTVGVVVPAWTGAISPRARLPVFLVGVCVAAYSVVDSHAVSLLAPPTYLTLQFFGAALLLLPGSGLKAWVRSCAGSRGWAPPVLAGMGSALSYLLLLYAFRLAPAAQVLAIRQAAPGLAPLVGSRWLHERAGPAAAAALVVMVGGAIVVWR